MPKIKKYRMIIRGKRAGRLTAFSIGGAKKQVKLLYGKKQATKVKIKPVKYFKSS